MKIRIFSASLLFLGSALAAFMAMRPATARATFFANPNASACNLDATASTNTPTLTGGVYIAPASFVNSSTLLCSFTNSTNQQATAVTTAIAFGTDAGTHTASTFKLCSQNGAGTSVTCGSAAATSTPGTGAYALTVSDFSAWSGSVLGESYYAVSSISENSRFSSFYFGS